jgi:hypothetical protein
MKARAIDRWLSQTRPPRFRRLGQQAGDDFFADSSLREEGMVFDLPGRFKPGWNFKISP